MKIPVGFGKFTIKSAVGIYETDGASHRVRVGLTPLGIVELADSADESPDRVTTLTSQLNARIDGLRARLAPVLGKKARKVAQQRVQPIVVGLKPERVTFLSEAASAEAAAQAGRIDYESATTERQEMPPNAILEDTIGLSVGKSKFIGTAKVRYEELAAVSASTGCAVADGHRFEPGPWALWRASLAHARVKPKRGAHLRYVTGAGGAVVFLSAGEQPLAWQVVARESDKEWFDGLLHAFHVLDLFAVRRLRLPAIGQISVQGADADDRLWDKLGTELARTVRRVPGPPYEPRLVAFGAALGAIDLKKESLNLAKSIQAPPRLLSMVPWGEVGALAALFFGMFLTLNYYISDTRQQLATLQQRAVASTWAKGMTDTQLKQESAALEKEVNPLKVFVTRDLYFSRGLDSLAKTLPPSTWLVNLNSHDLIWEKSPNKALGQRYIMINAAAPSATEGTAPPEINAAVQAMNGDEYLSKVLPNVKLTDVNWHQQAGTSFALFSVLALPKQ